MVPTARMIAWNAIEPTNCALIDVTTVSIAQLSCGNRKTCVQNKASKPARPILSPYRTLRSPKRSWPIRCDAVPIERARDVIVTVGRAPAALSFPEAQLRTSSPPKRSDQFAMALDCLPKPGCARGSAGEGEPNRLSD